MLNCVVCLATILILSCASFAATSGGYSVIKKVPIHGQGGWDYLTVDESARRLDQTDLQFKRRRHHPPSSVRIVLTIILSSRK
jgi:hypothetical protein